jgi:hypothetical protein
MDTFRAARWLIQSASNSKAPTEFRSSTNCVKMKLRPLIFVTGNAGKLREVMAYLGNSVPSLANKKVDLPELQGDPIEISKEKCRLAAKEVGPITLSVQ